MIDKKNLTDQILAELDHDVDTDYIARTISDALNDAVSIYNDGIKQKKDAIRGIMTNLHQYLELTGNNDILADFGALSTTEAENIIQAAIKIYKGVDSASLFDDDEKDVSCAD